MLTEKHGHLFAFTGKPLNSGHPYGSLKIYPLLRGARYWEIILKGLSQLKLNILSAIHGLSAIWDAHY